ncbi:DUF2218 domain-containing protein [Neorhizobium sp. P12A]|jgi:hypothetical protein|uniref:DUF2218 domain-containing protein n=1 Tax=Rhizobium/Agrobacterium group TaxID=227290 RepID=UPI001042F107|nr:MULTISPECIES: DUF2218 domain-containing protein [Rhizobium/Agrobacterium group]KAA0698901.1 DUF2218 domain-containing protein [Neorhizobium sp. P12A]TCR90237.1 hypothetical protein EV561_104465 [Rhizobium sp. BK376]
MYTSTADVKTEHGSRYLQQLCKHWSHRFTVEFDEKSGKVPFSDNANVEFTADPSKLHMVLNVAAENDLERMQNVVADHLKRFAFREELEIIWTRQ